MKNENNKFMVRRIPLQSLLTLLTSIYNKGADYVDFHGVINEAKMQDEITVSVLPEYLSKGNEDDFQLEPDREYHYEDDDDDDDDDAEDNNDKENENSIQEALTYNMFLNIIENA